MTGLITLANIEDKPECFAIPDKFNIVRPCCENCEDQLHCGLTIEQLGSAIQEGAVSSAGQLKEKIYAIKRSLDYWDTRPMGESIYVAPELMEKIATRVIEFGAWHSRKAPVSLQKSNSDDLLSDQEIDALLAVLPNCEDTATTLAAGQSHVVVGAIGGKSIQSSEPPQRSQPVAASDQLLVGRPAPKSAEAAQAMASNSDVSPSVSLVKIVSDETAAYTTHEPKYHFVVASGRPYQHLSFDQLKVEWRAGIEQGFGGPSPAGYLAVREAICAISVELNLRATWAPRFREWPKQVSDADRGLFFLDKQVIDCHWLAVRYTDHEVANEVYENILRNAPFDFEMASRFATEDWHWYTKAVYLNLNTAMEWELSAIQSEAVRKDWLRYREGDISGAVVRSMGSKQMRSFLKTVTKHSRLVPAWVNIWLAAKIAGENWIKTAAIHSLMTGASQLDRRQIAKTHETIMSKLKNK